MKTPTETKSKTVLMGGDASTELGKREAAAALRYADAERRARRRPGSRRRRRLKIIALCLGGLVLAAIALAALNALDQAPRKPAGQVVATVNGREITLQDLRAEARANRLTVDASTSPRLLAAVVDRVLMAQEARRLGLDQTATYPSDKVRAEQNLLAERYKAQVAGALSPISDAEARDYVKAHPYLYEQRQDLSLDQVSFRATDAQMAQLGETPTMATLLAALARLQISYVSSAPIISTADMAPQLAEALLSLPDDGVVIARQGGLVVASSLIGADPTPLSVETSTPLARTRLRRELEAANLEVKLRRLHEDGKIVLRTGEGR